MGLLSNSVGKDELKAGDHIYTWRTGYVYAHHGIYVGHNEVIHFTRAEGQEVGTGVSMPKQSEFLCPYCTQQEEGDGVIRSCLDCFLAGGSLYRFEYSVDFALFFGSRRRKCTRAHSDPVEVVVNRARYWLNNEIVCYDVFKNCEGFSIYCKTGLLAADQEANSGHAASIVVGLSALLCIVKLMQKLP